MKNLITRASLFAFALLPATVQAQSGLINPDDRPGAVPEGLDIRETIVRILNYVLSFVGLIAVAMLIYAGFLYLFGEAGGDTAKAKTIIVNVIIGILLILASWVIVNTVIAQFSGVIQSGNPGTGN